MTNQSDNGSFFLSEELDENMNTTKDYEDLRFVKWRAKASMVFFYLSLGIAIIGLFGNMLCAKVMGKVQKTVKGVRLIKYLTIVDMLVLVLLAIVLVIRDVSSENRRIEAALECIMFLLAPIYGTIYMLETNLTVLIAVQRCLALTIPFKFKRVMRNSVINKLLTGIVVFTVIFNIPEWIDVRPVFHWNEDFNMTMIWSGDYNIILSKEFIVSWTIVRMMICHIIPVFILAVCNIVLIISRRRMTRIYQTANRMGTNQLTAIIIAIIAMSVLVHCMFITLFIVAQFKDFHVIIKENPNYTYRIIFHTIYYLRDLVVCVNSSTNFIFYCTFGREFRLKLAAMFQRTPPTQQPQQLHNDIEMKETVQRVSEA